MTVTKNLIRAIVEQMADDEAPEVTAGVYIYTAEAIRKLYGENAHTRFVNNTDATDDKFYLTISAEDFFDNLY